MKSRFCISIYSICLSGLLAASAPAKADSFFFSSGNPDGLMASASRPDSAGKIEIESADDFVLTSPTSITSATFTGLLPSGSSLSNVVGVTVEIYRVFPLDSDVNRTSGAPTFSTSQVPTRVNSPSDVAFAIPRLNKQSNLPSLPGILQSSFTAANSVLNGIHPLPGRADRWRRRSHRSRSAIQRIFTTPSSSDRSLFLRAASAAANGDFFWLSSSKTYRAARHATSLQALQICRDGYVTGI